MSIINRLPKGLQEFLGNTQQGVNPSDLSQTVVPQFDMSPFWSLEQQKIISLAGVITTAGNGVFLGPVPVGETWVPLHLSGIITGLDEGDDIRMNISFFAFSSAPSIVLSTGDTYSNPAPGVAANRYSVAYSYNQKILAPSGSSWGIICEHENFTQPSETITATMYYVRLRA